MPKQMTVAVSINESSFLSPTEPILDEGFNYAGMSLTLL